MQRLNLIILLFVLPLAISAQLVKPGLIAGGNLGKWNGNDVLFAEELAYGMNQALGSSDFSFTNKSRFGFLMGMVVDFQLTKFLSLQPEVSYSQKGTKFSGTGTVNYGGELFTVDEDLIVQLDYIDLVLLAKCFLTKSNVRPYILAGPGMGYLVSSRMKAIVTINGDTETDSEKADGFRKIDTHLNFGCGFDFSRSLSIEFRYYHFLNSLLEESNNNYDLFNSVKQINLIAYF